MAIKSIRLIILLSTLSISFLMTGCSHWRELNQKQQGAAIGAGSGALIGTLVAGPVGTVVGGIGGALGGGVVGAESGRKGRS